MRTHRAAPLDIDGHITIKRRPEKKGKNKGIKTKKKHTDSRDGSSAAVQVPWRNDLMGELKEGGFRKIKRRKACLYNDIARPAEDHL
jgi:hypothetical protein